MWNTEAGTKIERKGQAITTGPNNIKVIYPFFKIAYAKQYAHMSTVLEMWGYVHSSYHLKATYSAAEQWIVCVVSM